MTRRLLLSALALALFVPATHAHFLWVLVNRDNSADVVFEHAPRIGDGHYLDPIVKRGKTWIRTPSNPKPTELKVIEKSLNKKKLRWLTSASPINSPCAIESYVKWGVYKYPKNTFKLLHYYARHIEADSESDLQKLARAEHLDLDIVPSLDNDGLKVLVLFKGKPAAGRPLYVRGPVNASLKTDSNGIARVKDFKKGRYYFRTGYAVQKAGKFEGKDYSIIHHQCTLTAELPPTSK